MIKEPSIFECTPTRAIAWVALVILFSEFLVMLLISFYQPYFEEILPVYWMLLDSIVLTILITPALYMLIFIPMRKYHSELKKQSVMLRENLQMKTLIETIPDLVWMKNLEGQYLLCNHEFEQFFGSPEADIVGKTDYDFVDTELANFFRQHDQLAMNASHPNINEEWITYASDSRQTLLETRKVAVYSDDGKVSGVLGIGRDITIRRQDEEKLRLAASVFSCAHEGIIITDAARKIIEVNDAFIRITGYSRNEILGQNPRILNSGLHDKEFYIAMWQEVRKQGLWHGEVWNRRKNGELYNELLTISTIRNHHGKPLHYIALFSDITILKDNEQKLMHLATHDALTGLPNRTLKAELIMQAMSRARRCSKFLAVVFIDLDGFKLINDNYGHEVGDKLLIALAAIMKQTLREGDTLARLGGDEFVAALEDLNDRESSLPMLNRLLSVISQPIFIDNKQFQITASLGVTFYSESNDVDADQLLRQADQMMYIAKQAGKNRYHIFDIEENEGIRKFKDEQERIRQALAKGELVLYYQPKVNMRTGVVIGTEALIRWQHPERGLLLPEEFLSFVRNHQLTIDIGEWVISTAIAQMEVWHAAGLSIEVSVNIDAYQLQQANFVERLQKILVAYPNVKPNYLVLEVLETSALQDLIRIAHVIDDCKEMGVMFALDDFGTGYSTLTYLKHLPVATLKIDHSFVRGMLENSDDLSILNSVINLGSAFRRQIIAEGVETVDHGIMLLHLGCELGQGYCISRPIPANELFGWASNWQSDPAWIGRAPLHRDSYPLLYAGIEHRTWIVTLENFLKGEGEVPPTMNHDKCHFGNWLHTNGETYFSMSNLVNIRSIHEQVHILAKELLGLKKDGRIEEVITRINELHNLRDYLLELINGAESSLRHRDI